MKYHHEIIDIHEQGDPWLIMVHGFTHNCHYFSKQVSTFQENFRILLTDLRGHGKSANVPGPYGIEEYADDVFAAIHKIGIEKAHFWGTHTGAAIGLVLALRHPERFTSLILEGTFLPGFPMPKVGELINRARSIAQSRGLEAAREDWFNQADWFAYIRAHPQTCRAKEQRALISEFEGLPWLSDLTPRQVTPVAECLDHIHQPTLVYNGKYDLDDFKRAALHIAQGLPDVQCEEIPDAGGFPGWENPQVVNLLVNDFLAKQAR